MSRRHKATFVTVVPSPYQRDLFAALAVRDDVDLSVHYMEAASPDSPWPEAPLREFERILPGFWVPFGGARVHFNWSLPALQDEDVVVLGSFTSWTAQWWMRHGLRSKRWLFWGERLRSHARGWRKTAQSKLTAPLANAAGIVGVGRAAENDYRRRFPRIHHFCIPYHCDLTEFLAVPRDREPGSPLTFLFCGQMIRRKGVDLLLTAFDRLVAERLDVHLLLVGREADLPEFLSAVSSEARARIRYEGFQPPERLPEFFARADVFVLPSRYDGWGVVVNQALGAGMPVIPSDAVGAGMDLVEDGVNGLQFASGDVDGLQAAMKRLVSDPTKVRQWGEASRRRASALSPEAGAEKWARVFDTVVGGR